MLFRSFKPSSLTTIKSDLALSNYDRNLFSEKDKKDNQGLAGKLLIKQSSKSFNLLNAKHVFSVFAGYEWVQLQFKPVERLRDVEFLRDWGLSFNSSQVEEEISSGGLTLSGKASNFIAYQIQHYKRGDNYSGLRQTVSQQGKFKQWQTNANVSLAEINDVFSKGKFFRPTIDIKKDFKKMKKPDKNWQSFMQLSSNGSS